MPGETRDAGSRQRWPFTVTRPSMHKPRARDHATPVRWRTTAATVGSGDFTSNACWAARNRGDLFSRRSRGRPAAQRGILRLELDHFDNLLVRHELHEA